MSRLFPNRNIGYLFTGQLISQIGDSMYQIGLMWLVLELTGSKSATGIVAMISHLPMLVFGLVAGALVDLYDRRRVMMMSDMLRALVVLMIPVLFYFDNLTLPLIVAISFSVATLSTVFNPARDSLLPVLAGNQHLVKSNSLIQVSGNMAIMLGPALAAALLGVVGVVHLFSIDAVTFLASLAAVWMIRAGKGARPVENSGKSLVRHLGEIARYIHQQRRLRFLLGLTAINNFFIMGPAIVGTPIFVREVLHKGASSYAIVESALGLGMILGSVLINQLVRIWPKGKILLIGLAFDGITYSLAYLAGSMEVFTLLIAFHAIGIPLIVVSRTSLIQEWTDNAWLGRVFSLMNVSVVGVTALTTGATGWIAEFVPIEVIFGVCGLGGVLCAAVGWVFSDLRHA